MLLSVYNDEDDEMEDAEDDNAEQRQRPEPGEVAEEEERSERVEDDPGEASDREDGARVGSERMAASDSSHESTPQLTAESSTPSQREQKQEVAVSVEVRRRRRGEMLCIVDYEHDEIVMSPEAEVHSRSWFIRTCSSVELNCCFLFGVDNKANDLFRWAIHVVLRAGSIKNV